jgi:hypothetical protein
MTGSIQIYEGDIYKLGGDPVNAGYALGTLGFDEYGDLYRYSKINSATAAVAGKLQLAPVQKTNHHNRPAAAAVTANGRAKQVTITLGATAAVAQEYAQGLLVANDVDPEGEWYRITNQPAIGSSETGTITVDRPFVSSITTSSEFTLVHNAWNNVLEGTAITVRAAGVPVVDAAVSTYAWLKTRGVAAVLIGTAATLGADLIVGGTAGSVTDRTDALGASAEPVVAVADIVVGVATEFNPVRLCID